MVVGNQDADVSIEEDANEAARTVIKISTPPKFQQLLARFLTVKQTELVHGSNAESNDSISMSGEGHDKSLSLNVPTLDVFRTNENPFILVGQMARYPRRPSVNTFPLDFSGRGGQFKPLQLHTSCGIQSCGLSMEKDQ
ncbi:hypothetical protein CDAR_573921 [Caerostris darwini]|uniref:Uncharacterized protein n=1 Tax=Caerostris darwini TaxID=1538125 RepID=A0AAV4T8Y3_9ARAC|nr:hypothetical protein CDAR_573921 [Caerostris darwini]